MNCEKTQRWIQALADDELSPGRTQRVQRHVFHCESCRLALAETRRVKATVAEARREIVAAYEAETGDRHFFWSQVDRQLRSSSAVRRSDHDVGGSWSLGHAGFVVAVCAVLMMFLAIHTFRDVPSVDLAGKEGTKVMNIATYAENTDQFTYVSADTGNTFVWIHGLPTEDEN